MMYIDVHAHYDDIKFNGDRHEIITKARESGVDIIMNCGSSVKNSAASFQLAQKYDFIYTCAGVHPHETEKTPPDTIETLESLLKEDKVLAVGEIGLDYFHDFSARSVQREWFERQMDLAERTGYPVIIHDRDAHADCVDVVKKYKARVRGLFHCYSGSVQMAAELLDLGYSFSIGGVASFSNAKKCHEAVRYIPIEALMLETDCPYLAPHPLRGTRNDSSNLPYIAQAVADLKGITIAQTAEITSQNALKFFGITK